MDFASGVRSVRISIKLVCADPVHADKHYDIAFLDLTNYPENAINFHRVDRTSEIHLSAGRTLEKSIILLRKLCLLIDE